MLVTGPGVGQGDPARRDAACFHRGAQSALRPGSVADCCSCPDAIGRHIEPISYFMHMEIEKFSL